MGESIPTETANQRAYERLEPRAGGTADRAYLLAEQLVTELAVEAMRAIGAERGDGELDPAAEAIFGAATALGHMHGQINQAIAEYVYRCTRRFLEARNQPPANVVDLFGWLAQRAATEGGAS